MFTRHTTLYILVTSIACSSVCEVSTIKGGGMSSFFPSYKTAGPLQPKSIYLAYSLNSRNYHFRHIFRAILLLKIII